MKRTILFIIMVLAAVSCVGRGGNAKNTDTHGTVSSENSIVNVYYFHGKQRCKTCVTAEKIAKETVEEFYSDNSNVIFTEIDITDKKYIELVKKYEVTWNALIIAEGGNYVDITRQAFANAVNSPQALTELIKEEVNKRLEL